MGIGERIKQARRAAGLTQQAFADAIGASQSAVGNWESGINSPNRGRMLRIAEVLRVSITWLEWGDDASAPETNPASFALSDDVFRACFEPLIFQFAGKKTAGRLDPDFYSKTNRDLHEAMAYLREHEPAVSVTSHLSQFLLLALGSMLGANPLSSEFDYPRWRKATDAAAQLALTLSDGNGDRRRKSG